MRPRSDHYLNCHSWRPSRIIQGVRKFKKSVSRRIEVNPAGDFDLRVDPRAIKSFKRLSADIERTLAYGSIVKSSSESQKGPTGQMFLDLKSSPSYSILPYLKAMGFALGGFALAGLFWWKTSIIPAE